MYYLLMALLCLFVFTPSATTATPADSYTLTDLGEVLNVFALDKSSDTVVSTRILAGLQRAVVLGAVERIVDLFPDGISLVPFGVDRGRVVGAGITASGALHAFLFDAANGIRDLGTLGSDDLTSEATDLNGAGTIVGAGLAAAGGPLVPLVWPAGIGPVRLPTLGGEGGVALALNDGGVIVGAAQTTSGDFHASLWSLDGGVLDIQTLPGAESSLAFDVNEAFEVVGILTAPGPSRGFRWRVNTGMVVLPPLPGHIASTTTSINEAGDMVGGATSADDAGHAVLWTVDAQPINLQDRLVDAQGFTLASAVGINSQGTIAALGFVGDALHAVLLTPVGGAVALKPPQTQRHAMPAAAAQALMHMAR